MKRKTFLFVLLLLAGLVVFSCALAEREIAFDDTAVMQVADSLTYEKTENNIVYYRDSTNRLVCGYRVSVGQVSLEDVKKTLQKSGYGSIKIQQVNGVQQCYGSKTANGQTTLMVYFNTQGGHFVMVAFTHAGGAKAKKIAENARKSITVKEARQDPNAPAFSWTGRNGAKITSVVYGGRDLILIYLFYDPGNTYMTYYLDQFESSMSALKKKGVTVLVCVVGEQSLDSEVDRLSNKYRSMVFGQAKNEDSNGMWTALERLDFTADLVKAPVVFLRSRNNRLRDYSVGELDGAADVVEKALAMASSDVAAVPPDPDELSEATDDGTVVVDYGKYKISGKKAVFIGVVNENITELEIPPQVTSGGKAYPVTEIAAKACKGLKHLKTLQIDSNVTKIGKEAFRNCKKLSTIVFLTRKLKDGTVGKKAFDGVPAGVKVKCPSNVIKTYQKWLPDKGIPKKASYIAITVK